MGQPCVSPKDGVSFSPGCRGDKKAVRAWVCYFGQGKSKSPSLWGALSWDLLQVGPCPWFHTARLVILLFLQSFADGLYSISVILERMRHLLGMGGEQGPAG